MMVHALVAFVDSKQRDVARSELLQRQRVKTINPSVDLAKPGEELWDRFGRPVSTLQEASEKDLNHLDPDLQNVARISGARLLRHQLPCEVLGRVLKKGVLESGALSKESRFNYGDGPLPQVFVELTNDQTEKQRPGTWAPCELLLSMEALNKRSDIHMSMLWWYGKVRPGLSGIRSEAGELERVAGILPKDDGSGSLLSNEVVIPNRLYIKHHIRGIKVQEALPSDPAQDQSKPG